MVAAVAVAMIISSRTSALPPNLSPQAALVFFAVIGGVRLSIGLGLLLALIETERGPSGLQSSTPS
jgi:NADH:ubiquinone oxidoreductase subunit K